MDLRLIAASSVARPSFPGYLTSEAPSLTSQQPLGSNDFCSASDFLHREVRTFEWSIFLVIQCICDEGNFFCSVPLLSGNTDAAWGTWPG